MRALQRQIYLQKITQRLAISMLGLILSIGLALSITLVIADNDSGQRSYLMLIVFVVGVLGGYISLQQRLPKLGLEAMKALHDSRASILLIPVNGGIFALVLMMLFMSQLVQGSIFPTYPDADLYPINNFHSFISWVRSVYPVTGAEVAKLLVWSFAAGFGERLLPQLIKGPGLLEEGAVHGPEESKPSSSESGEGSKMKGQDFDSSQTEIKSHVESNVMSIGKSHGE